MRLLCDFGLEIGSSWRRRIIVMVSAMLLAMAVIFLMVAIDTGIVHCPRLASTVGSNKPSSLHRKLLRRGSKMKMEEPNRIWGEKCTKADIVINQGPTAPLPNGIPTYSVEIMNVCVTGCDIFSIHLNCGWFSSARLINPKIFKRLRYNDCLVNDGKPLTNGDTLSFKYANTYLYPLSVNSVSC